MKQRKIHKRFLITVLFFIILYSCAFSQSFLIKDVPHDNLSADLRFLHPFYKSPGGLNALSGIYDLNISVPIVGKWNINMAVPFVVYKYKVDYQLYDYNYSYEYSKNVLGNIYLGLQTRDSTASNVGRNFSFGVFLPTADKNNDASFNANFFGLFTNYYDLQKYLPETIALYSNLAFRWYLENGIRFGLDVGPQYLINISDKGSGGNNFFMHYGLSGGIKIDDFVFKSEFTGILILTGDAEDFSDRFLNFLSFGLSYMNFVVKPSLFYQFNFHELYKNVSTGSLGIKLSYILE